MNNKYLLLFMMALPAHAQPPKLESTQSQSNLSLSPEDVAILNTTVFLSALYNTFVAESDFNPSPDQILPKETIFGPSATGGPNQKLLDIVHRIKLDYLNTASPLMMLLQSYGAPDNQSNPLLTSGFWNPTYKPTSEEPSRPITDAEKDMLETAIKKLTKVLRILPPKKQLLLAMSELPLSYPDFLNEGFLTYDSFESPGGINVKSLQHLAKSLYAITQIVESYNDNIALNSAKVHKSFNKTKEIERQINTEKALKNVQSFLVKLYNTFVAESHFNRSPPDQILPKETIFGPSVTGGPNQKLLDIVDRIKLDYLNTASPLMIMARHQHMPTTQREQIMLERLMNKLKEVLGLLPAPAEFKLLMPNGEVPPLYTDIFNGKMVYDHDDLVTPVTSILETFVKLVEGYNHDLGENVSILTKYKKNAPIDEG